MDNSLSVDEMNKMLADLKASYSKYYEVSELNSLEENLQNLLQRRQEQKAEFLRVVEEQLVLREFEKQPDDWLTLKVAEAHMLESKENLAQVKNMCNRTDKIQELVDVTVDALNMLKEKLDVLEYKIKELQEKTTQLNGSCVTSSTAMQQSDIQCNAMKVSQMLVSVQNERDIIRKRVQRMEKSVNSFKSLSSEQSRNVAAATNELSQLEAKLKELEKLSGMKWHLKDSTSLEIEFLSEESLQERSGEDGNVLATPDDVRFTVTVRFQRNKQNCLELKNVQTNQIFEEAENLIKGAMFDKDLPKLMTGLKKIWQAHLPLITEISQIKSRHAVDWIQEKGMLSIIPRRSSSVVCSLKVPSTYPFSGQIVLDSIMGHMSHIDPSDVPLPSDVSLMGWVRHLENFFGLP